MDISGNFSSFIKNPQMYKFLIVGIGAACTVLSLTVIFTSILHVYYMISVAIAFMIALIWGFFAHDKWTFANVQKTTNTKSRFIKYNIISLAGLGVNEAVLSFFTIELNLLYTFSEAIAIVIGFFFNYLLQKKISWKN